MNEDTETYEDYRKRLIEAFKAEVNLYTTQKNLNMVREQQAKIEKAHKEATLALQKEETAALNAYCEAQTRASNCTV